MTHRPLTADEVRRLEQQGCRSDAWTSVSVLPDIDLGRVRDVELRGTVRLGSNRGTVQVDGVALPCGISHAILVDCDVGNDVRIDRIGSVVSHVIVEDGAVLQDVDALTADAGAACGAGTEIETVNEAGGRVVRLVPLLTAQTAWLQAFRLHDPKVASAIFAAIERSVDDAKASRVRVGAGAHVLHCGPICNVQIGPAAVVRGTSWLEDGTILSCPEHPTLVGEGVQARHFIIAEGAAISGGALLEKVFIGQAVKLGKQFSAENCLFFANCEGFHGEAVSIFAGPYTVTHHKSTLLIAAQFSFYNAGSGTNQSNHMYKLGPVHQGLFERGCKTGSSSYVLHETHVGAFSVVIGKHYTNINTPDLPFSYIHESDGHSEIVPGMTLFSVGTVRDGEKWPKRDGRKAPVKRDRIVFDVFSPFTVEKMRVGRDRLLALQESTPKEKSSVAVGGVVVKRLLLRRCAKYYALAVSRYLNGKVLERIEAAANTASTWSLVQESLDAPRTLTQPLEWTDMAGLLVPVERLRALEERLAASAFGTHEEIAAAIDVLADSYCADEWQYVCAAFEGEYRVSPNAMSKEQALAAVQAYAGAASALHGMILDDSQREFDAFARISYGLGMTDEERALDFATVRGSAESNGVVQKLVKEKAELEQRRVRLEGLIGRL